MSKIEKQSAICGVCNGGCAIEASIEDGKLTGVAPLKGAPYGKLCVRGKYAPEIVNAPDRLTRPLIRTGERGEGRFREATWDEALDYIVERMLAIKEKYGPQAMASYSGRGALEQSLVEFNNNVVDLIASQLLIPFGSPNIASCGSLCYISVAVLAPMTTLGLRGRPALQPDFENSKLIVVWGTNPITDSPPLNHGRIMAAQKKGIKLVAIDQMRTDIANRADEWIAVRSGTDGALALGMLNVIINEELYDKDFVKNWTVGFAELKTYVQQFPPEEVERITWVPREKIATLAREIATAKHAALHMYTGLEYTNSGVQNIRAVYILWAITGNLDVPGGLLLNPIPKKSLRQEQFKPPADIIPIGATEYPLFHELTGTAQFMEFPKAILEGKPYSVKGILINAASILTSYPQPEVWEKAYDNLEFMAVIDRFMTRDALFADVVLPATTFFEISSFQRYPGYIRLRRQVIDPVGEARSDLMIFAELAKRLGYGHYYPQSEEELFQQAFESQPELLAQLLDSPDGVALKIPERNYKKYESGLLRHDCKPGFDTPSGKVEITSSLLKKHGYDALPVYVDPVEGPLQDPETYRDFPLILNTGVRTQSAYRSQHLNIPGLVKLQERPLVLIHPIDAEERGIKHGDKVSISTKRGNVYFYADVTIKVLPGTVEANMGGGNPNQAEAWREANVNILTDYLNRDPISGFPVFKALLCQVQKLV